MKYFLISIGVLLGGVAIALGIGVSRSSLEPLAWTPPEPPSLTGILEENTRLQDADWLELAGWYGPEDIAVDAQGNIYAGVHDGNFENGAILKLTPDGEVSVFSDTGSWVTGLHIDAAGNLIACDQARGLISVDQAGNITTLATHDEYGRPLLLPNDVDIASDGMIYFSNSTSTLTFSLTSARQIIMEQKPVGGLYRYDPNTQTVTTLIEGGYFSNGVAVSADDSFVLLVDTGRYQIRRHWLTGERAGQTEMFMENLPGFANGISRRADGSFWLGFSTRRNAAMDTIHPHPWLKKLVFSLPMWLQPEQERYGIILNISATGEVIDAYFDPTGNRVPETSSVTEYDGTLLIGGDLTQQISRYSLE